MWKSGTTHVQHFRSLSLLQINWTTNSFITSIFCQTWKKWAPEDGYIQQLVRSYSKSLEKVYQSKIHKYVVESLIGFRSLTATSYLLKFKYARERFIESLLKKLSLENNSIQKKIRMICKFELIIWLIICILTIIIKSLLYIFYCI